MLKSARSIAAGGVILAVVVATVTLGALALTQTAAASTSASSAAAVLAHRGGGGGACRDTGRAAAAEALGMTTDELSAQLWGGKTLADLATEAGVKLEDVQAAVNEACAAAQKEAIEQAVTDGQLTREHADWLLEGLEKGFWGQGSKPGGSFGGPDFGGRGGGFGPRGPHGPDFRVRPDSNSTPVTPTGSNS